jgi:hypothetical protein
MGTLTYRSDGSKMILGRSLLGGKKRTPKQRWRTHSTTTNKTKELTCSVHVQAAGESSSLVISQFNMTGNAFLPVDCFSECALPARKADDFLKGNSIAVIALQSAHRSERHEETARQGRDADT